MTRMDKGCLSVSGRCADRIALPAAAMDRLMPMHLHLNALGQITACGPTLAKIASGQDLIGQAFFALFEVRRPAGVAGMTALFSRLGERLHLRLRAEGGAEFRGLAVPDLAGGIMVNLSFGIGVVDAVRANALTDADFAATDLTVELLYVVEVKRAILAELQRLNLRLQGAKTQAEEQALTDALTGLRNRRALNVRLAQALAGTTPFALMHLDLDLFKAVNDTMGHAAGDHVLRVVAQVLTRATRSSDLVARVGGDEFVLLLPGLTDRQCLTTLARRIITAMAEPITFQGQVCQIGASVGMTLSTHYTGADAQTMLQDADTALYAAKRAGRGQMMMFCPHSAPS